MLLSWQGALQLSQIWKCRQTQALVRLRTPQRKLQMWWSVRCALHKSGQASTCGDEQCCLVHAESLLWQASMERVCLGGPAWQ